MDHFKLNQALLFERRLETYNFPALNRWDRFRVWLGHRHGIVSGNVSEGVTGLGTHSYFS